MREIKFRAWEEDVEFMNYSVCVTTMDGEKYCEVAEGLGWIEVNPEHVMQFTGLKDENSTEIYEGDVVRISGEQELDYGFNAEWNHYSVVRWNEVELEYYLDVINKKEITLAEDAYFTYDNFPLRKCSDDERSIEYSVVGNIYENPELLEKEQSK